MLTINQLQYFISAVQYGSINKAAKFLFISQPALTKQLIRLEQQLNCKLIDRTPKGIELTEAGRYLYNRANTILNKIKETELYLQHFQHKKIVRIGAIPSMANFYLPNFFKKKNLNYTPQVFVQDISQMLANSVKEGKIDIAIVQDYKDILALDVIHLFTEQYVAVFPCAHPLAKQETIHFQDFIQYPIHMWHDPSDLRNSLRNLSNYYEIEPIFIDVPWNESLLSHVLQHQGVSFIPETVGKHIDLTELSIRSIKPRSFNRKIQVISKKENFTLVSHLFSEPNIFDTMPISQFVQY